MRQGPKDFLIKPAICCLLLALGAFGQSAIEEDAHSRENRLIALEHLWNEAQVNRDASALAGMIGDKFVNTEWDGEVTDRQQFLAGIADPHFKATLLSIQEVKVELYHDMAVVTGNYRAKGTYGGRPYDHVGRFTDTWAFENGRWLCVASHTSLVQK